MLTVHFGGDAVELFWAEKIATFDDQSTETCRLCAGKLALVRTVVDSESGAVFHMFKCDCGERTWNE